VEPNLHGTETQLELYALGRLPDSELLMLEEHLMICEACQERLDGIEDFAVGMREALGMEPAAHPRSDWLGWAFPSRLGSILRHPAFSTGLAFAALIIVVGIFANGRTKFAPSASLQLTATRGEMPFTVPAREFDLTLSDGPRDGGPFRIEVVNAAGVSMWRGSAAGSSAGIKVSVMQALKPGDYFVRLFDASGKVLHEYGFRVKTRGAAAVQP
jgi:hypothetical protein